MPGLRNTVVNKNRHGPSIHPVGGEQLTHITTEECVIANGDNGFAGKGLGVFKTNKKCVWVTGQSRGTGKAAQIWLYPEFF